MCTMYADRIQINWRNVTGDPQKPYRANRDFFLLVFSPGLLQLPWKSLE